MNNFTLKDNKRQYKINNKFKINLKNKILSTHTLTQSQTYTFNPKIF